jgi:peptide/nickel transport system ATP-binding protein
MSHALLDIRDLAVSFRQSYATARSPDGGYVRALDGISLRLPARSTLGLVGESGSGKSVTALSILRLLPEPPARIDSGQIVFHSGKDGAGTRDLLRCSPADLRHIRGGQIAMVFQEPMTALNPVYTIGDQVGESLRAHQPLTRREGLARAVELLDQVGVPDASRRVNDYPHQLSGGQRQRVMIAMALSCRPEILIADEPTTALDVTTQAQILDLLSRLQQQLGMSMLLISHDLGVIATVCQHVAVMYAGQIVESAPARTLFRRPRHPYTVGLLTALPRLGMVRERLREIPGRVPRPGEVTSGCRFAERCPYAQERCRKEAPVLLGESGSAQAEHSPGEHLVRCHFPIDSDGKRQEASRNQGQAGGTP